MLTSEVFVHDKCHATAVVPGARGTGILARGVAVPVPTPFIDWAGVAQHGVVPAGRASLAG